MKYIYHVLLIIVLAFFGSTMQASAQSLEISSGGAIVGEPNVANAITGLEITGTPVGDVPVKLLVTNGTLEMGTTTGLTFTGPSTGSVLQFTGTLENVNAALATLTYQRATTGSDQLEISLVEPGEVFFEDNGHLYEYITFSGDWNSARTNAQSLTRYGATGYLATILTADENSFVAARLEGAGWMGGSDVATEGDWKWVTGPEAGTSFWSGNGSGSVVGGNYANWNTGEPNDSSGNEDCSQFLSSTGFWNDLPCSGSSLPGYVAEFGADGDMPDVVAQNIDISIDTKPTIVDVTPDTTGVALDADLVMEFDKAVTIGTGNITLRNGDDNSILSTVDITTATIQGDETDTLSIDLGTLQETTQYLVTLDQSSLIGTNGLAVDALGDLQVSFTTLTTPKVTLTSPEDNRNRVQVESDIIITFSEAMNTGVAPDISITPCDLGDNADECPDFSGTWSEGGTVYTLENQGDDLRYSRTYTVTVDNGEDANEAAGLLTAFSFSFNTEDKQTTRSSSTATVTQAKKIFAEYYAQKDNTVSEDDSDIPDIESTPDNETQCSDIPLLTQSLAVGDIDGRKGRYEAVVTEVATLQKYLNTILTRYNMPTAGPVDGIFGPMTKSAVQRVQELLQQHQSADLGGFGYDGIVGPLTRSAINNHCTEKTLS